MFLSVFASKKPKSQQNDVDQNFERLEDSYITQSAGFVSKSLVD